MNTSKTLPLIIGIIVVFLVGIILYVLFTTFLGGKQATATIKDTKFAIEVTDTQAKREKGLSGRKSLGENNGMLFSFDKPDYHRFWMKDMQFPLDILFLQDNKIVTLYENVPAPQSEQENANPPVYTPTEPVNRVLELPAGTSRKLGIKKGDSISLDL